MRTNQQSQVAFRQLTTFVLRSRNRGGEGETSVQDVLEGHPSNPPRPQGRGKAFSEGVGWLSVAYTPHDGKRSSASVAYVHPSESTPPPPNFVPRPRT